jgi:hypothetical protein
MTENTDAIQPTQDAKLPNRAPATRQTEVGRSGAATSLPTRATDAAKTVRTPGEQVCLIGDLSR